MRVGAFYFPTDYGIDIGEQARARGARFEGPLLLRAHRYPGQPALALSGRRRVAQALFPHPRSVRRAVVRGDGDAQAQARDRHCAHSAARPDITAKSVASLDQLSGGRFIFAIGGGWNVEEMENHGARYETRFKLLRERVLAMKALWTQEEAEFYGEFVNFDPVWLYPKPKQKPHPPILLGGRPITPCAAWSNSATAGSRALARAGSPGAR